MAASRYAIVTDQSYTVSDPTTGYTEEQMKAVEAYSHRKPASLADKTAYAIINFMKWGLNKAVGYKDERGANTEERYMIRNIFLESVAGVPGMVAAMIRHLHSMRRMKRDNGWIETLLEESYNERMHLLVFMKMHQPGKFMRLMVLGAQGVWFNFMFVSYLMSPRIFHRFVGYLEELATSSYTRQIEELEAGLLPKWENLDAPEIAVEYWKMPEGHRKMINLLYYIRADESKHREVNHTLSNLNQTEDPNPYVSHYRDPSKPHPDKGLLYQKSTGWERDEVI
jgi:ubiquinol oxidase